MKTLNKVTLIGRLGQDPIIREHGEIKLAELNIATDSRKKDIDGTYREATEWHKIKVFNAFALKHRVPHLKKGNLVYIEGSLKTNIWKDKQEVTRYDTDIYVSSQDKLGLLKGTNDKKVVNES